MKKILLIAAIAVMLCSCGKKNSYTIIGNVPGLEGTVTLMDDKGEDIAEAPVKDGKFTIKGIIEEPALALLSDASQPLAMLFLEPGKIRIEGTLDKELKVTGTKANESNSTFNEYQYTASERMYGATTDAEREAVMAEIQAKAEEAMNANLDNYFGLFMLTNFVNEWDSERIISKLDEFAPNIQNTQLAAELRNQAESMKLTEIGNTYREIVLPDAAGTPVALSSLVGEGKYVLLDFWASWCTPCMAEVPYLKEVYAEYKEKGFEIYGVTLDREESSWINAMTNNQMNWTNVSAINDAEQKATTDYAIQSIPANFLIGPDGKIIAKNLRDEELKAKIAELLGE